MTFRGLLANAWMPLARRAAASYVVGTELADAIRACTRLGRSGIATTLCFWNGERDTPRRIAAEYVAAIDSISASRLDCYLSVKAPPLEFSRELFGLVFSRARAAGAGVHFDSMGPESADEIFRLAAEFGAGCRVGCTLPGRWRRSCEDASRAMDLGLDVRIVKGQWPDADGLGVEPCAGFLRTAERLSGYRGCVRVATHDPALARAVLGRLCATGTTCELELLFGLPFRHMLAVARAAAVPVRMYVPYGKAWLPYALHQAGRNPKILFWAARDLLAGRSPRLPEPAV